jgi:hypothetical protein
MDFRRDETHCSPRSLYGTRRISVEVKSSVALEDFMEFDGLRRDETHCSPRTFYGTRWISVEMKPIVPLDLCMELDGCL